MMENRNFFFAGNKKRVKAKETTQAKKCPTELARKNSFFFFTIITFFKEGTGPIT